MISITEEFIEAAAPNADAAKNGRSLVLKGKFLKLHHSPDETLLFGQCQGSGTARHRLAAAAVLLLPDRPIRTATGFG